MRSLTVAILVVITFICAMRFWQYEFGGIRISAAEIAALLFDFVAAIYLLGRKRFRLPKGIPRGFVLFNMALFCLALFSALWTDWFFDSAEPQYLKNLLSLFAHFVFVVLLVLVLVDLGKNATENLLKVYLFGVIVSAIWCFAEIICAANGVELNKITFGAISTYKEDVSFIFEWDFFFRATGFAGVNAQATYLMSAVPLLLIWKPFDRRGLINLFGLILCLMAMILTMSKNAIFSLLISLLFLILFHPSLIGRKVRALSLALLPIALLGNMYWEDVVALFETRVHVDEGGFASLFRGRSEIFFPTIDAILERPIGYGLGQFHVYIMNTDVIDLTEAVRNFRVNTLQARLSYANVHSNWLNWTFEYGILGGLLYVYYYMWILRSTAKARTPLTGAVSTSVVALMVAGIFNNTLDQFSVQLFIVLAVVVAYFELESSSKPPPAMKPNTIFRPALADHVYTIRR